MSETLLQGLQFIRENMRSERQKHLQEIYDLVLSKRYIGDREILVDPKKWGDGWMPAPFNRMMNRFAIFIYLIYNGQFQMAKEILKNTNMLFLEQNRKSIVFEEYADKIMYEIVYILTIWVKNIINSYKKGASRGSKEVFKLFKGSRS